MPTPNRPPWPRAGVRERERYRRGFRLAIAVAALAHVLLLRVVPIPMSPPVERRPAIVVAPPPADVPEGVRSRPGALPEGGRAAVGSNRLTSAPRAPASPRPDPEIAVPIVSPAAPLERTIPATTLGAMQAALLPLVVTPTGIGRRTPRSDSRRLAIMRAESLANARLASLTGAEPQRRGPVGLANGGVTIGIPWGGFLPEDRRDAVWRAERCKGKSEDRADKPGEKEARRSQCD